MSKRAIKALILSAALVWATQAIAQQVSSDNNSAIRWAGDRINIFHADIPRKLLWAGVALINPRSEYTPVPLYGYPMKVSTVSGSEKEADWENVFINVLGEAAKGNVHIAIVFPTEGENDVYEARGIWVGENFNEAEWNKFRKNSIQSTNALMAFTRPLNKETYKFAKEKEEEFIALPRVWQKSPQSKN